MSPRSGLLKLAQYFSAGYKHELCSKPVKRATDRDAQHLSPAKAGSRNVYGPRPSPDASGLGYCQPSTSRTRCFAKLNSGFYNQID